MQVVHPNCAGIDVHKRDLKVCAVRREAAGPRSEEVRTFGTMTKELEALRAWLCERGIRVVAIESTGVYWKPVFNLLEADFQVILVNPAHCRQMPGRKTDVKDCQWLAQLLEHGLLKGSFIPRQGRGHPRFAGSDALPAALDPGACDGSQPGAEGAGDSQY